MAVRAPSLRPPEQMRSCGGGVPKEDSLRGHDPDPIRRPRHVDTHNCAQGTHKRARAFRRAKALEGKERPQGRAHQGPRRIVASAGAALKVAVA